MKTYYLGLATTYHDPAVALVDEDGQILFAEAVERYLQNKRAMNAPADTADYLPKVIERYCDPNARFVVAETWSNYFYWLARFAYIMGFIRPQQIVRARAGRPSPALIEEHEGLSMYSLQFSSLTRVGLNFAAQMGIRHGNKNISFRRYRHHLTHAATGCYTSPFSSAMCLVVDGFGEKGSMSYYRYDNGKIKTLKQFRGRESLGFLYMAITRLCGFDHWAGEEWKVMGLAPYGKRNDDVYRLIRDTIWTKGVRLRYAMPGRLRFMMERLETWRKNNEVSAADLAFTGQELYSEYMTEILCALHKAHPHDHLVLGGGCALNSAYNGRIVVQTPFKSLHVPSAPADDGNAVGAAFLALKQDQPNFSPRAITSSPYLGAKISSRSLENLVQHGRFGKVTHHPGTIAKECAKLLADGKLLGWMQGRAEFGPRSLGNRSILADPRPREMKDKINALVKYREEFRPFAPSVLHEFAAEYFEDYQESPYMERTLSFKKEVRAKVPAVCHVDNTGRLQTVKREWNERFYDLISAFREQTGVPILLNTSFNVMGKPIIHSVEDALAVFYTTGLDALAIDDYLFEK